ncbi:MAG: hypothetical protein ACE5F1_06825 [Planctomycetota bacterium]
MGRLALHGRARGIRTAGRAKEETWTNVVVDITSPGAGTISMDDKAHWTAVRNGPGEPRVVAGFVVVGKNAIDTTTYVRKASGFELSLDGKTRTRALVSQFDRGEGFFQGKFKGPATLRLALLFSGPPKEARSLEILGKTIALAPAKKRRTRPSSFVWPKTLAGRLGVLIDLTSKGDTSPLGAELVMTAKDGARAYRSPYLLLGKPVEIARASASSTNARQQSLLVTIMPAAEYSDAQVDQQLGILVKKTERALNSRAEAWDAKDMNKALFERARVFLRKKPEPEVMVMAGVMSRPGNRRLLLLVITGQKK